MELRYHKKNQRGVFAANDIKKGEAILYVPHSQILTMDVVSDNEIGRKMMEQDIRSKLGGDYAFFCSYLMLEMRKPIEERKWGAYLETLPKKYR